LGVTAEWDGLQLAAVDRIPTDASTVATASGPGEVAVARDAGELVMHPELESIFRAQYPAVVAVARRVLRFEADAEDVAQEVFVSFARSAVPAAEARAWLTVAATHTALNVLRSRRRRVAREVSVAESQESPDAAVQVIEKAEQQRVRDALANLPHKQAVVLVLRYSGLSYADIAETTQLSPSSVGTTLRRAELALRKELSDDPSV
jgi:RNA polymerase sigma factor (sigma-70 family)